MASTLPVARASATNSNVCAACSGMNCDGVLSAPRPVSTHANISARYSAARRNSVSVWAGRANDSSVAHTPIASAHTIIRAMARRRSPRFKASTMNGKLAAVFSTGTSAGTPSAQPMP